MNKEEEALFRLLKREMEMRFQVDDVKPKFDENENFIGFTYRCSKEEHEEKARQIDGFLKVIGLINIDYVR